MKCNMEVRKSKYVDICMKVCVTSCQTGQNVLNFDAELMKQLGLGKSGLTT